MEKIRYPLMILCARDWNLFKNLEDITDKFDIANGWITGFLIRETDDCYVLAAEIFPEEDPDYSQVRYTQAIPKETVLFKKIIHWYREKKK